MISERFWGGIGRQLRCPSGAWGRLAGHAMSVVNQEPNRLAIAALDVQPADTALELGFGSGRGIRALSRLAPHGLILGIDRSPEMVAQATRLNRKAIEEGRAQLHLGNFDKLPWPAQTVDKILAVNVGYFFAPDGRELCEARRLLRPGGRIAMFATHRSTMSHWRFAAGDTHALLDEERLRILATRGGFHSAEIVINSIKLPFGVRGLIAVLKNNHHLARAEHRPTNWRFA